MFRLFPFKYQLCALGNSYDVIADACRDKTKFFSFLESRQWRSFKRSLGGLLQCDFSFYPVYYWFLLVFSAYGVLHSLLYFGLLIFTKDPDTNTICHNKRFYVLSPVLVKRFRIFSAFIQTNAWASLMYAAVFVSPRHMAPWLWIHIIMFALKLSAATINIIFGRMPDHRNLTIIYLIVYALSIWTVRQSMTAFTTALKQETPEKLMLFS
ncbi:uncharacterized protein LOC108088340 [Drosophila ficusphila]|uniref:uncharacterized protein LOC108088340 n=1 Tax=Drosophila ficusphila TaxID=30025 RepID=UPI0007E81BCC|nr:uncharacterized protein LOC108088340 [Drosophila ficusphila]